MRLSFTLLWWRARWLVLGAGIVLLGALLVMFVLSQVQPADNAFSTEISTEVTPVPGIVSSTATTELQEETPDTEVVSNIPDRLDPLSATAISVRPPSSRGVDVGSDGCQVSFVGDSIASGYTEPIYVEALAKLPCAGVVDGLGGRSLQFGWQCKINNGGGTVSLIYATRPTGNPSCEPSGLELLRLWRDQGSLGDIVVIALGTNDAGLGREETWRERWQTALDLTGDRRVVFVSTAARPGSDMVQRQWAYSDALRRWCTTQSRCALADWGATKEAADASLYGDRVHLGRTGVLARAEFIAALVRSLLDGEPLANPAPLPTVPLVIDTTTTSTSTSVGETLTTTTTTTVSTPTPTTTTPAPTISADSSSIPATTTTTTTLAIPAT